MQLKPKAMLFTSKNAFSKNSLIFLLTAIGLITLPHVRHLPTAIFSFFFLVLGWRCICVWRTGWLPGRLPLLVLTAIGMLLLYKQHQGMFGRDAGTSLFVVALGLKLLEIRSHREIYLIAFLAFIVAASQFLYEQSILMAAYILLVCIGLMTTLILQNVRQIAPVTALKTAGSIILQALPIAIIVFLFFPRLESPHWLWLENENQAKSGLSKTLEPGSISNLSLSDELVFRVSFIGKPPPANQRYWRGPVYSYTDGSIWLEPDSSINYQQDEPGFNDMAYRYTLLMEPQKQNWVFGMDMPAQFDKQLKRNSLFQLVTRKNPSTRAEYLLTSYPNYNTGKLSKSEATDNLQLPGPVSEKIVTLVKQLQGFDAEPQIFIQNLLNYFRDEKFRYTLTPPLMPENPIETFLFEVRSGFCSHFATAFVYLMRAAQIPSRVVGGYQGGEYNKVGGFLEVRQADAHAWAEVWLADKGWVRFDPTAAIAPERIEQGVNIDLQIANRAANFNVVAWDEQRLSWLKRTRQAWQSLDYNWQRWVINYDTANQSNFLRNLGISNWQTMAVWLIGSLSTISLLLAWQLLKSNAKRDKALLCYQRFCRKMAKSGINIRTGEGARDFAERAKSLRPDLAAQIELITALFIRLRYEKNIAAGDLPLLTRHIRALRID